MNESIYRRLRRKVGGEVRRAKHWIAARTAPKPQATIELIFDGASRLNWRLLDGIVDELRLTDKGNGCVLGSYYPTRGSEVASGYIDLGDLPDSLSTSFLIEAVKSGNVIPFSVPSVPREARTANVARTPGGLKWRIEVEGAETLLLKQVNSDPIGVVELKSTLGFISLRVRSPEPLVLEMRRRKGSQRIKLTPLGQSRFGEYLDFRVTARDLAPFSHEIIGESVWDVWGVMGEWERRLGWVGSDVSDPRSSIRFRKTSTRNCVGYMISYRPYWTKNQLLAIEIEAVPLAQKDSMA